MCTALPKRANFILVIIFWHKDRCEMTLNELMSCFIICKFIYVKYACPFSYYTSLDATLYITLKNIRIYIQGITGWKILTLFPIYKFSTGIIWYTCYASVVRYLFIMLINIIHLLLSINLRCNEKSLYALFARLSAILWMFMQV